MDKVHEAEGIKEYVKYVKTRLSWINSGLLEVSDNQANFYKEINEKINEYARTHQVYLNYLFGRISSKKIETLLGETDRQVFRYLKRQRENLIEYIQEQELILYAKYPFNDELKISV